MELGHVIVITIVLVSVSVGWVKTDRTKSNNGGITFDYDYDTDGRHWPSSAAAVSRLKPEGAGSRGGGGCPPEFDGNCTCEYRFDVKYDPNTKKQKFFVDCTSSGFTNTSMLKYLPLETEVLVFVGNEVRILQSNIFGKSRPPNLRIIDMSDNQIREIDGKAFHRVDTVEILNLAHNSLTTSSLNKHPRLLSSFYSLKELYLTNTFDDHSWSLSDLGKVFAESNLTRLEKVHLGLNELTSIPDPSTFCSLPALRHLYIPQNHLTDNVVLNVTCLPNLEVVDLRQNKIRTLTPSSNLWKLLNVTNVKGEDIRIELLANPFDCNCNLKPFIKWLKSELVNNPDKIRDNENLQCDTGSPANNTHMYLRRVQAEGLTCDALPIGNSHSTMTTSGVATGVLWTVMVLVILVILTSAYAYRFKILRKVSPLIQSASSGVHYTSIEKSDTAEIAHV